jgi:hypothetical protein
MTEDKQRAYEEFKSHNWYKLWKNNFGVGKSWGVRKTIQAYLQETEISEWINYSMYWDATQEGQEYWDNIHSIWWCKYYED